MLLGGCDHPGYAGFGRDVGNEGADFAAGGDRAGSDLFEGGFVEVDGEDVAIIAYGNMVQPSIAAASNLEKEGIDATVINARFVKPLDADLVIVDSAGTRAGRVRAGSPAAAQAQQMADAVFPRVAP